MVPPRRRLLKTLENNNTKYILHFESEPVCRLDPHLSKILEDDDTLELRVTGLSIRHHSNNPKTATNQDAPTSGKDTETKHNLPVSDQKQFYKHGPLNLRGHFPGIGHFFVVKHRVCL